MPDDATEGVAEHSSGWPCHLRSLRLTGWWVSKGMYIGWDKLGRDVTRPQSHEAEAEATTHEAEAEAEATAHEAEAEAEATTHEVEAEAEAKTHLEIFIIITVSN